jgi:uncharacterized protein (TIGR03066 family)
MNALRFAFLGCLFAGLVGCGPTQTGVPPPSGLPQGSQASKAPTHAGKPSKDTLAGKWEVIKPEEGKGTVIDFTKDGKMTVTTKGPDGKELTTPGTFELENDQIKAALKAGDKEHKQTLTITKLSETELITKDEKGKIEEYKKK